ncbi:hypothetical protein D9611_010069 [Ephemerocybe angulata]|uniref:Uncharacterized protein n=1 Tax=Ephemerocybe angulata TaxID=980116 RepID=A0A8H5AYZ8_9AGAR|nr:hypothetical protein D9611_010069 [Tulosesus angulatus]
MLQSRGRRKQQLVDERIIAHGRGVALLKNALHEPERVLQQASFDDAVEAIGDDKTRSVARKSRHSQTGTANKEATEPERLVINQRSEVEAGVSFLVASHHHTVLVPIAQSIAAGSSTHLAVCNDGSALPHVEFARFAHAAPASAHVPAPPYLRRPPRVSEFDSLLTQPNNSN